MSDDKQITVYACHLDFPGDGIWPVVAERATDKSVWIKGRKRARRSGWESYFDSWDEAHAAMLAHHEREVEIARRTLERAKGYLGNVKGMKKP